MNKKQKFMWDDLLLPFNMIQLYATGAFPMADELTEEIHWYKPEIRTVIPLDNFNVPRSLKKILKEHKFKIEYDHDFLSVVKNCANRKITWINQKLIDAYLNLEKLGHIHTVEVYEEDNLIGGLYGISYQGAFFGESMFSNKPQASKIALVYLVERLRAKGFVLLDVQYPTDHLAMFGAIRISFFDYQKLLKKAYKIECEF